MTKTTTTVHDGAPVDLVLEGGWVIDPARRLNGRNDVAIAGDRIVAVAPSLAEQPARRRIDVSGRLVCPGFIDIHGHVYEYGTDFGLNPDDAGIHSGVTTLVDQGSAGAWTFPGFKAFIIDRAETEILSFISINLSGTLRGCKGGPIIQSPDFSDVDVLARFAAEFPSLIRGIKGHGESGSWSRWGRRMLEMAREAGDRTGLPLYVHTGQLWPVDEKNKPDPDSVIFDVLKLVRPGDTLAHVYSAKPDGILGTRQRPPQQLLDAIAGGVLTDIGHGVNFSFRVARAMMAAGVLPHMVGSDVHGDFYSHHNDATLDYSLFGAMSKLLALGIDLEHLVAGVTINPARVLRLEDEIGTLAPGSRADVTIVDRVAGAWSFRDGEGATLTAQERLLPALVVRAGRVIEPSRRLLRDVEAPALAA